MSKEVIILRSVSGAGKTTAAEMIRAGREDWVICCADDFFETPEGYVFDPDGLMDAHRECGSKFKRALFDPNVKGVIVANTNTTRKQFRFYEESAAMIGARVFFFVVENRHGGKDVHNVPEDTLERQEQNIRNSLQLR